MSTLMPTPDPVRDLILVAPDLRARLDVLSQRVEQSVERQEEHIKTQAKEWERAKERMQQTLDAQTETLRMQAQLLKQYELQAEQHSRSAAFLASHIAVNGMIPKHPFGVREDRLLWSHLKQVFAAEPAVFGTDERKRAFAFAHLDWHWRERYEDRLRNRRLADTWQTLSDYIRDGRG